MLTAHDVRGARFARTRFREGYDIGEVDALLGRAAATLEVLAGQRPGPAVLTARDVADSRFMATKFRDGYDQVEVDDFLDALATALASAAASASRSADPTDPPGAQPLAGALRTVLEAHAAERAARSWDSPALRAAVPEVTRRGPGYVREDVDAFLERAARSLDDLRRGATPELGPQDVRAARFREAGWRAERYDQDAIDALLDRVEASLGN
ncbi:DivIVA domain-containing protein [Cellulomonas sp. NS3]|uniref:DivIVA domain-containing protein n=1 Tax=Cellulomonas sp. NS3 TaxID=2973977 RepID=UPI002161509B|nr:DivIVA domain-containing protein [Cellulomonas sp. NS3]